MNRKPFPGLTACLLVLAGQFFFRSFLAAGQLPRLPVRSEGELLRLSLVAYENGFHEHSLEYARQFARSFPESSRKDHALLLQALNYRHLERYENALLVASRLVDDFPAGEHRSRALYLRGEIDYRLGRFSPAADAFRLALGEDLPGELVSPAYQGLVASLAGSGDFSSASRAWLEWEGRFPGEARADENRALVIDAAINRMQLSHESGEYARVHADWSVLEGLFPDDPDLDRARYLVAAAWRGEGALERAAALFRGLVDSPDERVARLSSLRLGDILFLLDRPDEAEPFYRRVVDQPGDRETSSLALYQLGRIAARRKDTAGAAGYLRRAFETGTGETLRKQALEELASLMFLDGDYRRAAVYYRRFQALFPRSPRAENAFLQECFALYNLGEHGNAAARFGEFRARYPESPRYGHAVYGQGLSMMAAGERDAAALLWEEFLGGAGQPAEHALMVLVLSRYRLGRNEPALVVKHLEAVFSDDSVEIELRAEAFLLSGIAFRLLGKPEKAISLFERGLESEPSPDIANRLWKNKADTLLAEGLHERSLRAYLEIRDSYPESRGEILYGIGISLEQAGRRAEAVEPYLEALVHLPADSPLVQEVKDALSRLRRLP